MVSILGKIFLNDSSSFFSLPCHDPLRTTGITLYKVIKGFGEQFSHSQIGTFPAFLSLSALLLPFNDGVSSKITNVNCKGI